MPRSAAQLAKKRKYRVAQAQARLLRALRKFARDRRDLMHIIHINKRRVVLFPEDVTARANKELLAFIRERCDE